MTKAKVEGGVTKKTGKSGKEKMRRAPIESAKGHESGYTMKGEDGNMWVVKRINRHSSESGKTSQVMQWVRVKGEEEH